MIKSGHLLPPKSSKRWTRKTGAEDVGINDGDSTEDNLSEEEGPEEERAQSQVCRA